MFKLFNKDKGKKNLEDIKDKKPNILHDELDKLKDNMINTILKHQELTHTEKFIISMNDGNIPNDCNIKINYKNVIKAFNNVDAFKKIITKYLETINEENDAIDAERQRLADKCIKLETQLKQLQDSLKNIK